jgi:hypothetical protein
MSKTFGERIREITSEEKYPKQIDISDDLLNLDVDDFSDGYHTFNQLYDTRAKLFAVICNTYKDLAWKSKKHYSDKDPMYDGMFIVGIETPLGPAAYHFDIDPYWDIFRVQELDRGLYYDGHTPRTGIDRILSISGVLVPPIESDTIDIVFNKNSARQIRYYETLDYTKPKKKETENNEHEAESLDEGTE